MTEQDRAAAFNIQIIPAGELEPDSPLHDGVLDVYREPFGIDPELFETIRELMATEFVVATEPTTDKVVSAASVVHHPGESMEVAFLATAGDHLGEGVEDRVLSAVEAAALTVGTPEVRMSIGHDEIALLGLAISRGYVPGSRGLSGEVEKSLIPQTPGTDNM